MLLRRRQPVTPESIVLARLDAPPEQLRRRAGSAPASSALLQDPHAAGATSSPLSEKLMLRLPLLPAEKLRRAPPPPPSTSPIRLAASAEIADAVTAAAALAAAASSLSDSSTACARVARGAIGTGRGAPWASLCRACVMYQACQASVRSERSHRLSNRRSAPLLAADSAA